MSYTYIAQGRASINFSNAASVEPAATELVERKACEGICGGWFFRPRPVFAKDGEKVCPACKLKLAEDALTASTGNAVPIGDMRRIRKLRVA